MTESTALQRYKKFCLITISLLYILILIGAIVRGTGSGMGCPDWPKCYGKWFPPRDTSLLPTNYADIFQEHRIQKNKKIAHYLEAIGMNKIADEIKNDPTILQKHQFDYTKAIIEYINRMVGVLIGFCVFITFVLSYKIKKNIPSVFWFSLLALILVLGEGFLGSVVVSTNLIPHVVSIHLLGAVVILFFLIKAYTKSEEKPPLPNQKNTENKKMKWGIIVCIALFFIQFCMGVSVRESVDSFLLENENIPKGYIIAHLGNIFFIHRSFSWVVFITHVVFIFWGLKSKNNTVWYVCLFICIILEICVGMILNYFELPKFAQPLHLFIASLIFGIDFYLYEILFNKRIVL